MWWLAGRDIPLADSATFSVTGQLTALAAAVVAATIARHPARPLRNPGGLPMTSSDSTVTVTGLRKRFGATVALDGVDATFAPGVNGLLGPNGAGKTTMLRILATVLPADDGRVEVLGDDPSTGGGRLAVRRRLGYLPQEPGFHRHFSAFDFVDYVAILKEWADRKPRHDEVRRVLTLVGLDAVMHKRIGQLSGGMRRRVGIAQALLGRPDLLVLDEPTAGLDPEQRLRFRELLGTEAAGATVLLSTHQTDDVAALCQHVVVLLAGQIRFNGTPAELAGTRRRAGVARRRARSPSRPGVDHRRRPGPPHRRAPGRRPAGRAHRRGRLPDPRRPRRPRRRRGAGIVIVIVLVVPLLVAALVYGGREAMRRRESVDLRRLAPLTGGAALALAFGALMVGGAARTSHPCGCSLLLWWS